MRSWSVTFAAKIVAVQLSSVAKSVEGSSVNVVGPPATLAVRGPLAQVMSYHPTAASTGSVNVMVMFDETPTPLAPFVGVVDATAGATSPTQKCVGDALLRGAGALAAKSAALLSVSTQPPLPRRAAVVFDSVGAAVPSKKVAPS